MHISSRLSQLNTPTTHLRNVFHMRHKGRKVAEIPAKHVFVVISIR
jgi:hypothetical protein